MDGIGVVVEVRDDGTVLVEVDRAEACGECGARGACQSTIAPRVTRVVAQDPVGVAVGQRVRLHMADAGFLAAVAFAFLIPLVGMLAGALMGFLLARWVGWQVGADVLGAIGALVGGGAGLLGMRVVGRRGHRGGVRTDRYQVWVSQVVP